MPSPFAVPIKLTAEERVQLEAWERRRTSAQALALRSRIVLAAAEGPNNTEIARELGVAVSSVRKWRNRFAEHRLDGLTDEPRPGQPRKIGAPVELWVTPGVAPGSIPRQTDDSELGGPQRKL